MQNDVEKLQGIWSVTSLEVDGNPLPAEMYTAARIEVRGERFSSSGMGAAYEGLLLTDETKNPRHLDMKFDLGPEKGNTNLCIYELEGDRWTLCVATRGTVRPTKFNSREGSGFVVETLKRGDLRG